MAARRALDEPAIRLSALRGGLDALLTGTTTLVDHHASPNAIDGSMHPLPADHTVEVTDEVIDAPQSAVYDQAVNRLHGQKAVMALTTS